MDNRILTESLISWTIEDYRLNPSEDEIKEAESKIYRLLEEIDRLSGENNRMV